MRPSAHLKSVVDVINEWKLNRRIPFDHILNKYFRDRRFIGSKDRQEISWVCYDIFRNKLILEWWAELGMKHPCLEEDAAYALKLIAVYLTLIRKQSPGQINALYSGEKYGLPYLERIERQMIETIWNYPLHGKDPLKYDLIPEHIRFNVPKWIYELIVSSYTCPKDLLISLNQAANLDLRVNTLKINRDNMLKQITDLGIDAVPTPYSKWGIRIKKRFNLNTLNAYKDGRVEIQDEGSQILCEIVNPVPKSTVIDYCAGAGGKSLALAMMMQNTGKMILCDTSSERLDRSNDRFRKAGVFNIQDKIILNTPEGERKIQKFNQLADKVLIDVPCSSTGIWRRHPDARFRLSVSELEQLVQTQYNILQNAAGLVKKGGYLIYSTCSILDMENQKQIERFLIEHPDFNLEPILFQNTPYPMLQLTPHIHGTDGFFISKLRKL